MHTYCVDSADRSNRETALWYESHTDAGGIHLQEVKHIISISA
jgi:hypothetical protein